MLQKKFPNLCSHRCAAYFRLRYFRRNASASTQSERNQPIAFSWRPRHCLLWLLRLFDWRLNCPIAGCSSVAPADRIGQSRRRDVTRCRTATRRRTNPYPSQTPACDDDKQAGQVILSVPCLFWSRTHSTDQGLVFSTLQNCWEAAADTEASVHLVMDSLPLLIELSVLSVRLQLN